MNMKDERNARNQGQKSARCNKGHLTHAFRTSTEASNIPQEVGGHFADSSKNPVCR